MNKEEAIRNAEELCKELGGYWEPSVWQNYNWHYKACIEVDKGSIEIFPRSKNNEYWFNIHTPEQIHFYSKDLREGVKKALHAINEKKEMASYVCNGLTEKLTIYQEEDLCKTTH